MDLTDEEPLRVRHPWECLPFRPPMAAKWEPRRRSKSKGDERPTPRFDDPRLRAAQNLGAVRVNFKYASFSAVMASHSEKANRDQFFESHHETFGYRLHEMDTAVIDLQYQVIELSWTNAVGKSLSMTLDFGIETDRNELIFGEDKASAAYFNDPDFNERLDFAEAFLSRCGASFERRVAGGLPTRLARRVVKRIFDARKTSFEAADAATVRGIIEGNGGIASYGELIDSLQRPTRLCEDMLAAMMCLRHIAIDFSRPIMRDTSVHIPRGATKGALRAFLAEHVGPADYGNPV